ncbi:MAG: hypothetical protein BroJett038_28370 [Chloroflexota bacterium]|nr:MAG: hypothetical protein BroJett038_28370 [Chloroflexota bacterium]
MSITVELVRENRVVLQTYSNPVDTAQIHELKNRMQRDILPAATGKIHIIADLRQVRNLPNMILSSGARMLNAAHPNTGTIVFITQNAFVGSMARVFSRIAAQHTFKMARSLDEALEIIDSILVKET